MAASFFFYDLETSGFDPRLARIMQFAGQRTNLKLEPIGEPINVLIKLTPDVLPSPAAILVTGITPQRTLADGLTEAEFLKLFYEEVVKPDTIFAGYNSIRFDDEFMRFLHWRNFYDAYEWHWKNGCSRWDLLDVVRMTRALRPDGIEWPFAPDGKPANRLEYLTAVNKLDHANAHDALADVRATISVARLLRAKQSDLFDYLLSMRDKKKAAGLVDSGQPFVYTSGRYPSERLHTTAAALLARHDVQDAALVYDLRYDPAPFAAMSVDELVEAWRFSQDPDKVRLPVKTLKYNRCPAIAPLGVIKGAEERLQLGLADIEKHFAAFKKVRKPFAAKVAEAVAQLDAEREKAQAELIDNELNVDGRLYDGFVSDSDRKLMPALRVAEPAEIADFARRFHDARLKSLLPLYKARNYPGELTAAERSAWDEFCRRQLFEGGTASRLAQYFARLEELAAGRLSSQQRYLLEELQLYGQSLIPADAAG